MTILGTRRSFLRGSAFSIGYVFAPLRQALLTGGVRSAHENVGVRLASVFAHRESAATIGREYLRGAPDEGNVDRLVGLICSPAADRAREVMYGGDTKALRAVLSAQQRDDFAHGRTIKVQGWILSVTEVRLCALAALGADSFMVRVSDFAARQA